MNNPNNNITAENNKPRLKKVKKPIKRVPPQMFNESPKEYNNVGTNPFQQQSVSSQPSIDPFDVDNFLDNSQLPAVSSPKNSDFTPQFITDEPEYTQSFTSNQSLPDNKKMIFIVGAIAFFIGFIFAKMIG